MEQRTELPNAVQLSGPWLYSSEVYPESDEGPKFTIHTEGIEIGGKKIGDGINIEHSDFTVIFAFKTGGMLAELFRENKNMFVVSYPLCRPSKNKQMTLTGCIWVNGREVFDAELPTTLGVDSILRVDFTKYANDLIGNVDMKDNVKIKMVIYGFGAKFVAKIMNPAEDQCNSEIH